MSGFNLPPGCSVSDLPGNSAADARYERDLESAYETLENDLDEFCEALDGHLNAPDEQMALFQMMWAKSFWPSKDRAPVSAQESLLVGWIDEQMRKAAEKMAEKAMDYGPDDYREDRDDR